MRHLSHCSFPRFACVTLCMHLMSACSGKSEGIKKRADSTSTLADASQHTNTNVSTVSESEHSTGASPGVKPGLGWGEMTAIGPRINQFDHEMSDAVIALNHKGQALAVWSTAHKENDPRKPQLMASLYRNHGWEPAFAVTTEPAQDPAVAINDQGDMVISYLRLVYNASQNSHSEERWVRRATAWTWRSPERIGHAETSGNAGQYGGSSAVALQSNGNAMLVFQQSGPSNGLYASYLEGQTWNPPQRLDQAVASHLHSFSFAGNLEGRGVLVWLDSTLSAGVSKTYSTLKARAFHAGTWETMTNLGEDTLKDFEGDIAPEVRVDSQGNAIVLYTEKHAQMGPALKTRDYNRFTKTWASALSPAPNGFRDYGRAALAMNRNGDAALTWTVKLGADETGGRLSYRPRGQTSWGQGLNFVQHASSIESKPAVALNGKGKLWIAWDQPKSNVEQSIHVRVYDPEQGLGPIATPIAGKRYKLVANREGQVLVATRRTVIGQNPLGYFSVPTACLFTP